MNSKTRSQRQESLRPFDSFAVFVIRSGAAGGIRLNGMWAALVRALMEIVA